MKAAVTSPAGQKKSLAGEDVEVAKVASFQKTLVNHNSKAAKGMYGSFFGFEDNLTDSFLHPSRKKDKKKQNKNGIFLSRVSICTKS